MLLEDGAAAMLLVTASEMAEMDRRTIEDIGIQGAVLMENAGRGAAAFFEQVVPDLVQRRIVVLAGSGNNGGDGFVLARLFFNKGARVRTVCLRPPDRLKGDALTNFRILEKIGVPVTVWDESQDFKAQFEAVEDADVIVDAILGTGLQSEVRGLYRRVIDAVNAIGKPVLSVDIPSGIDGSTGRVMGAAIRATATATFALAKIGHAVPPGEEHSGILKVIDIGIPPLVVHGSGIRRFLLDSAACAPWLRPRPAETHKGHAGHLGVLAGSPGKTGAAALLCQGAAKAGAGLVTLFVPSGLNPIMEVKLTEAMTLPISQTLEGTASLEALEGILGFMEDKEAFAMGPGSSLQPETRELMRRLIREIRCPAVLDADALTAVSEDPAVLSRAQAPLILTPHPGEMARLTGESTGTIQADRLGTASRFSEKHGVFLVLKGHRTVVAAPDGRLAVNGSGTPAMASGGMGDVLTGLIGAFLAQGFDPFEAACLGVYIHGAAAEEVHAAVATRGLLASEILPAIPIVIGRLERSP
jgi:NAD(P)H-hydrate epimerase